MTAFDLRATTTRSGQRVDDIDLTPVGGSPLTAYLTGHEGTDPRPGIIALHDERTGRADTLPELLRFAAKGAACLCIDSPAARDAHRDRDPAAALAELGTAATAGIELLRSLELVDERRLGAIGWGLGAEATVTIAHDVQAIVAIGPIPWRSRFVAESDHPLAAGTRRWNGRRLTSIIDALKIQDFVPAVRRTASTTHWLIQRGEDDRVDNGAWQTLRAEVPDNVRTGQDPRDHDARRRFLHLL